MFKRIQRDLLFRHIGPFVFCFVTVMFLLLMQFLMLYIDKIVGKGLPFSIIIELILTNLAYMVVLAGPMSVLVASLMAFGSFSEHNEYTVLKSAGIHPFHVLTPVLVVALLLSLFLAWFSNSVLPEANFKARALFLDIRMKKPGFDLQENIFYDGIDGYTFLVKRIDQETDSLYDIQLFQDAKKGRDEALIRAKRGKLVSNPNNQTITLHLKEGSVFRDVYRKSTRDELLERSDFGEYRISFDTSELAFSRSNPENRGRNDRTMNAQSMFVVIQELEAEVEAEISKIARQNKTIQLNPQDITNPDRILLLKDEWMIGRTDTLKNRGKTSFYTINQFPDKDAASRMLQSAKLSVRAAMMNYNGLLLNLKWKQERISKYWVEIHKKAAIPLGCLIFVLLGAPIGLFTQKGNLGVAAVIAALIFTFYWISIIQGEKLADRLVIPPSIGMWTANLILTLVGLFLVIKMIRGRVFPSFLRVKRKS